VTLDVLEFHRRTNHTYASVRRRSRGLDWANRPHPFKEYLDLPIIHLPSPRPDAPGLENGRLTLEAVGHILHYSAGVTRVRSSDGEPFYFRAYACAGALYPIEVYAVTGELEDLAAGVYHYHPKHHALIPLRDGDHRGQLVAATAGDSAVAAAPVTIVLSGIYWRTMWKYEARGYRHLYWDSGMILANLFALTEAMQVPARLVLGFIDETAERLLGLDGRHEVSLELVPLGTGAPVEPSPAILPAIDPEVQALSAREIENADAIAVHDESRLRSQSEVEQWKLGR
jgi:SagB-type dehydrogenase family enzyme